MKPLSRHGRAVLSVLLVLGFSLVGVAVPSAASAAYPACTGYSDFHYGGWIKHVPSSQYQNNDLNCVLSRSYPAYRQGTLVLQEALRYCTGQSTLATDGLFGEQTFRAVTNFQVRYNARFQAHIAEDGVYGPQTRQAMDRWGAWPTYNTGISGPCTPYQ